MKLQCEIQLPASKSESNRALMFAAYGGFEADFQNLSNAHDTLALVEALSKIQSKESVIDIADCGTAARFLTTYLACREGEWLLTGTERMKQRPIKPLVDVLMRLGADIQYVEKQGFLPLQIHGQCIRGGKVSVDMTQSSQFASSLLMAAPMCPQSLELELLGKLNSEPYLDMTISMMRHFGAEVERKGRMVYVTPKPYRSTGYVVSADWSAASYWYEAAALSDQCAIRLYGLRRSSLQGDEIVQKWMEAFGVKTIQEENMLYLTKVPFEKHDLSFDFSLVPDLFPTMAATCAGLSIESCFTGIANLTKKESDRIESMGIELAKIGAVLKRVSEDVMMLKPKTALPHFEKMAPLDIDVHGDHRVAMAMAPLSMKVGALRFDHPEVVEKSYPDYWKDASVLPVLG